jgi:hypothetical protein
MVTPADPVIIPTDPEERRQMIAGASDERLKEIYDAVHSRMNSLIFEEPRPQYDSVSDDYVVLTECLKQIEAERKRAERSN